MLNPRTVLSQLTESGVVAVDEGGDLVNGFTLRLRWFDALATVRADGEDLLFTGMLPSGVGRAKLTPQRDAGVVSSLKEQKLGVKAADDAYLVFCDDDGFSLLTRCADEIVALAGQQKKKSEIVVDETALKVRWPGSPAAIPALWEKLVNIRNGG